MIARHATGVRPLRHGILTVFQRPILYGNQVVMGRTGLSRSAKGIVEQPSCKHPMIRILCGNPRLDIVPGASCRTSNGAARRHQHRGRSRLPALKKIGQIFNPPDVLHARHEDWRIHVTLAGEIDTTGDNARLLELAIAVRIDEQGNSWGAAKARPRRSEAVLQIDLIVQRRDLDSRRQSPDGSAKEVRYEIELSRDHIIRWIVRILCICGRANQLEFVSHARQLFVRSIRRRAGEHGVDLQQHTEQVLCVSDYGKQADGSEADRPDPLSIVGVISPRGAGGGRPRINFDRLTLPVNSAIDQLISGTVRPGRNMATAMAGESVPADQPCVFIVDDDADLVAFLFSVLSREGFSIVAASNGQQALDLLERGMRPHVILIDLMLPRVTGTDVLDYIRTERELRTIPRIAITGASEPVKIVADAVFRKPFDHDELVVTIRGLINGKSGRASQVEKGPTASAKSHS